MKLRPFIIVFIVSIGMAILNSLAFFTDLIRQPAGTVYLGTIHYWEDYFYLLNHFFQGAHGAFLAANQFTHEATPANLMYWNNVMMGKLGGFIGLPPAYSYNLWVLLLSFFVILSIWRIMKTFFPGKSMHALIGFLFAVFSTSMINRVHAAAGGMAWWPFQIWGTPHFAFDRLGGAPHHLLRTLMSMLFFLVLFDPSWQPRTRKRILLALIVTLVFASVNPVQAVLIFGLFVCVRGFIFITRKQLPEKNLLIGYGVIGIAAMVMFFIMNYELTLPPYNQAKIWEANQDSYTTIPFLLLSIGPVVIPFIAGVIVRFKKMTGGELFGLLFILVTYTIFLSPVPQAIGLSNLRVLAPISFTFFGVFAAYGIVKISEIIKNRFHMTSPVALSILLVLYGVVTIPTLMWELGWKLPANRPPSDPLLFLPTDMYNGFAYLEGKKPFTDAVLANPATHMDMLVPALSGHNSYSGHLAETINAEEKKSQALAFFHLQMTTKEAKDWLEQSTIRYILYTRKDGSPTSLQIQYPFLRIMYQSSGAAVFQTE